MYFWDCQKHGPHDHPPGICSPKRSTCALTKPTLCQANLNSSKTNLIINNITAQTHSYRLQSNDCLAKKTLTPRHQRASLNIRSLFSIAIVVQILKIMVAHLFSKCLTDLTNYLQIILTFWHIHIFICIYARQIIPKPFLHGRTFWYLPTW